MFLRFWDHILKMIYEKDSKNFPQKEARSREDAEKFYDISKENMTAIIANTLSVLSFGNSSVSVDCRGFSTKRSRYLDDIAKKEFTKAKRKITVALGVGMIASIPYCTDNGLGRKIYIDTVAKDRFYITGMQGDEITEITVLADVYNTEKEKFLRLADYSVKNGVYKIRNRAINEQGEEVLLNSVKPWENIEEEINISGVTRLPVAFFSCPVGARRADISEGLPITYGCDRILEKIADTLDDIENEFKKKKVKIIAPKSMLLKERDREGRVIGKSFDEDLYEKVSDNDSNNQITIFDPSIRESSYFARLEGYFSLLEKAIGTSKGILTDLVTRNATATEIKRAMNQTFCITDDIRKEYVKYFDDLMYGVDVLLNYYSLTPISGYNVNYDWNYGMIEDSVESFNQLLEAKKAGAIGAIEIRKFLKPDEPADVAKEAIEKINSVREEFRKE